MAYLGRLRELCKVLDHAQKQHLNTFDMNVWAKSKSDCGAAACALGHACFHPPFKRAGLRLKAYDSQHQPFQPFYKRARTEYAGAKFFGITETESIHLFTPGAYRHTVNGKGTIPYDQQIQPKHVKARVRALIRKYERRAKRRAGK